MSTPAEDSGGPLLRVEGLRHTFHLRARVASKVGTSVVTAVRDVSFEIPRGQTLALVGESGSGKSTVARCVSGVYQPDQGTMALDGTPYDQADLRRRRQLRRRVQMVFQDPSSSLNPRHRVRRILSEPLRAQGLVRGHDAMAARVHELLDDVGLPPDAADRYPHQFSGGQRQRIAIARALSPHPSLVICDEAVSALDVSVQGQVLNLLRRLQREHHLTYLFISHDMAVVRHIADHVAVMYRGEIVEQGEVDEVFSQRREEYTRRLLAAVPRGLASG